MPLYAVSGSKLYISTAPVVAKPEVTAADFAAISWIEVSDWTQAGSLGDTQEVISQTVISVGRVRKIKGTRDGGTMENTFLPNGTDPGQQKFKEATKSRSPYAFRVDWSAYLAATTVVTIAIASPGVITWTGHGLVANQPISFSTTGALPTGLSPNVTYYVKDVLTANTFSVSATPGGAAIATTGTQSGVHTAVAQPPGQTDMFYGLALPGAKSGGEANTAQLRAWSIAVDSDIVEV